MHDRPHTLVLRRGKVKWKIKKYLLLYTEKQMCKHLPGGSDHHGRQPQYIKHTTVTLYNDIVILLHVCTRHLHVLMNIGIMVSPLNALTDSAVKRDTKRIFNTMKIH